MDLHILGRVTYGLRLAGKKLGVIDDAISIIWIRRYWQPGEFTLRLPNTTRNRELCVCDNLVRKPDADEIGIIEELDFVDDATGSYITAKGRMLSALLDRRITGATATYNNMSGADVIDRMVFNNARAIPLLSMGTKPSGITPITVQMTYKNVLSYTEKICQQCGMGFRITADVDTEFITMKLDLYKGASRTVPGSGYVEFSERFGNIGEVRYSNNIYNAKHMLYVGGRGEGDERIVMPVALYQSGWQPDADGFISAVDISSEGLTDLEYRNALAQRGQSKLLEYVKCEAYEFEVIDNVYEYKRDWDVGDTVVIKKESWGLSANLRVVEVMEIYESEIPRIVPTLGNPLPTSIDWEE